MCIRDRYQRRVRGVCVSPFKLLWASLVFQSQNKMTDEIDPLDMPSFDPTQKKKKKKKTTTRRTKAADSTNPESAQDTTSSQASDDSQNQDAEEEYTYDFLLDRAFQLIGKSGHDTKNIKIPLPQAYSVGTKKTLWANFPSVCKALQRDQHKEVQHLLTYVCIELGTTANLDGSGRLVITGRFTLKQLESLLRSYIAEYVKCKTCGSRDTKLDKDKESRLWFVKCNSTVCGSRRTVPALNKGYVHTIHRKK
eukprot:TRINITY_DN2206_c0_g1_i2.p1 TRINITY_DN2206_c0_g1~~TRINITY_DN2206_c0_g1_i2.p1  ORF type:complete len:251 (+),score=51.72 TRINITY_DN2206_c0_g1_i2:32-784(+)